VWSFRPLIIIVIIVVAAAVGGGRWVFTVRQTIRATCSGYHPRMYFSRMPRRLANIKNRFPGVKINTPANDRAATGQSSPSTAHAAHTINTWHRSEKNDATRKRVVRVCWVLDPATIDTSITMMMIIIIIIKYRFNTTTNVLFWETYYIRLCDGRRWDGFSSSYYLWILNHFNNR